MRKLFLALLALLIIIGASIYLYKRHEASLLTRPQADYSQAPGPVTILTSNISADPVVSAAWQVFESYRAAAKNHDIEALARLSYRLSATCANAATRSQCYAVMDRVASTSAPFTESDFTHASYDARQLIISTDWRLAESDVQIGYERSVIYFVRDASGRAHVLFFTQPYEIVYSFIDPKATHATLVARLNERIKDSDGDYVEDEYETCQYEGAASSTPACVPTDPHKMDSSGDGWWDSIEQLVK